MYFADDTTDIKVKLSGAKTTNDCPIVGGSSRIVEATGAMDAATVIHTVTNGTAEITVVDGGSDAAMKRDFALKMVTVSAIGMLICVVLALLFR
jgi:hypothetical protein